MLKSYCGCWCVQVSEMYCIYSTVHSPFHNRSAIQPNNNAKQQYHNAETTKPLVPCYVQYVLWHVQIQNNSKIYPLGRQIFNLGVDLHHSWNPLGLTFLITLRSFTLVDVSSAQVLYCIHTVTSQTHLHIYH